MEAHPAGIEAEDDPTGDSVRDAGLGAVGEVEARAILINGIVVAQRGHTNAEPGTDGDEEMLDRRPGQVGTECDAVSARLQLIGEATEDLLTAVIAEEDSAAAGEADARLIQPREAADKFDGIRVLRVEVDLLIKSRAGEDSAGFALPGIDAGDTTRRKEDVDVVTFSGGKAANEGEEEWDQGQVE